MALPEIIAPRGDILVAVGVDPTTGKYYPLPINGATGAIVTDVGAADSGVGSLSTRLANQDFISYLSLQGKTFTASPSDAVNSTVTGQTSFASTTPTFLLNVPTGKTAIPLFMGLSQAGTVAGGDIIVLVSKDKLNRYSSGGTAAGTQPDRSSAGTTPSCTLRTNPTATAGIAVRMMGLQIGPDVSPAEGVINEVVWTPAGSLDFIDGPGAWLVYTYAGTTGPTWLWEFKWAEVDTSDLALA